MKLTRVQEELLMQIGLNALLNGKASVQPDLVKGLVERALSETMRPKPRPKAKKAIGRPKGEKWTSEQRAKFEATMARKRAESQPPAILEPKPEETPAE